MGAGRAIDCKAASPDKPNKPRCLLAAALRRPGPPPASFPQQDRALSRSASTAGSEGGGGPDAKALAQQLAAAQSELAALKSARAAEGGKLAADCEMWRERSEGLKAELGAAQKALEGSELAGGYRRGSGRGGVGGAGGWVGAGGPKWDGVGEGLGGGCRGPGLGKGLGGRGPGW